MTSPDTLTGEAADRLAIRGLVDAWAHCADRRKPQQQAELFVPDGIVTVYQGDPAASEPVQQLRGHTELAEAFKVLGNYDATTHFNGQSTITLDGDRATGETYCLAHHLWAENGQRILMVMSIRYLDTFVRHDGQWLFAERQLITDWTDKRPSTELPVTPATTPAVAAGAS
jgi:SnoaL-like domain